jgi:hypothetical protein
LSIQGWIGKHLIFAGRLELLRSVLYGKVQFWLNIFPLPEIVIRQITSIYRNFLWTGDVRKSTSALVAWKYVCLPKAEGGLRLFDIKARNMSFLAKQLWNIHLKSDSVWIRWVHHFYLRNEIIWTASAHHSSSPLWKSIIFLRDYTIQHYGSQYGSIALMSGWNSGMDKFMSHAYNFFRPSGSPVSWERVVWEKWSLPKHCFILWLAVQRKLRTRDRLPFLPSDPLCVFCQHEEESHGHLFFCL